jgi:hypothetical protein
MKSIYQFARNIKNRLDSKIILLMGLCCVILMIATIFEYSNRRSIIQMLPSSTAQSNLKDFYAWPSKDVYSPSETQITHIQGALPNMPIYWTNIVDGSERTSSYQYGQTDGAGNFDRTLENIGNYGTGILKFRISVGGVTKEVEFQVGNIMTLGFSKQSIQLGDVVTIQISGAPPNQPIYWSGWKNFIKVEASGYYQQNTDANGNWSTVWNVVDPAYWGALKGQWFRSVAVGQQTASATYAMLEPYLDATSVRYEALRSSAANPGSTNETKIFGKVFTPSDYDSIRLCALAQRFTVIRAKAISVTHLNNIDQFSDIKGWVILRPIAFLTPQRAPIDSLADVTIPASVQAAAGNDLIAPIPGGYTYFPDIPGLNGTPGFYVNVHNNRDARFNLPFKFVPSYPNALDAFDVIVFANYVSNRKLLTIPYGDRGTVLFKKNPDASANDGPLYMECAKCIDPNMQGLLLDVPAAGNVKYSEFVNWLSTSGCGQ